MMERPWRSSSFARAKTESAPSPLMTDSLEVSGAFLFRGERVRRNRVLGVVQNRETRCHQLFIPAGQSAVTEQRLQESGDALGQSGRVRKGLEHVGYDAPLLEQGVVDGGDFQTDLVSLEQGDAGRDRFLRHVRRHTAARTGSGAGSPWCSRSGQRDCW